MMMDYQKLLAEEVHSIRGVQTKLIHYPGKLRAAREKVATCKQHLHEVKRAIQTAEASVHEDVANNPNLKNETQRKAALTKGLASNPSIQAAQAAVRQAEGQLEQAEIELQQTADEWRALRYCQEGSIAISRLAQAIHGPHDHPNL